MNDKQKKPKEKIIMIRTTNTKEKKGIEMLMLTIGMLIGLPFGMLIGLPFGLFIGYRRGYNVQIEVIDAYQKELYSRKLKTDAELKRDDELGFR